jgi:putative tricarboxylic transport membrane protein
VSPVVGDPQVSAEQHHDDKLRRPTGRTVFFAIMLAILVGYLKVAFDLEWRTQAGRIGPGFFPRIIGVLGVAITVGALVQSWRSGLGDEEEAYVEDEVGEGDLGRHPVPVLVLMAASFVFLVTLNSLGAIISGALFLFGTLWLLNRGHWVLNAALSVGVPLALYLLFQTALNAGLPGGLLPRF